MTEVEKDDIRWKVKMMFGGRPGHAEEAEAQIAQAERDTQAHADKQEQLRDAEIQRAEAEVAVEVDSSNFSAPYDEKVEEIRQEQLVAANLIPDVKIEN